jgi:hypothetical protein
MMPKTVRIYGTAPNLIKTPPPQRGEEVWLSNSPLVYGKRFKRALTEWTRWFNIHSRKHIISTYPSGWQYYITEAHGRPVYTQVAQPELPSGVVFPGPAIQAAFALPDGRPNPYFTSTVCWLIALAILEGFERIELWGFRLTNDKRRYSACYEWERPGFFYWVQQARDRGIEVTYQKEVERLPFAPGDPTTYTGPLYGYDTKPEE